MLSILDKTEYTRFPEAHESRCRIRKLLEKDELYKGENTELVRMVKGLIHYKLDPDDIKNNWVFCGGFGTKVYTLYWKSFWNKTTGKVLKLDNDCNYIYHLIVNPPMYVDNEWRYSCICNQKIHNVLFITNKDDNNRKLIVIGSCCNLKFLGGCPCLKCGYKLPHVKKYCKSCLCFECKTRPHDTGYLKCYICRNSPQLMYADVIKELDTCLLVIKKQYDKYNSKTNLKRCSNCRIDIQLKYTYCFRCYAKQTGSVTVDIPTTPTCIECKSKIDSRYTHCYKCYSKDKTNVCKLCNIKIDNKYTECFKCSYNKSKLKM